MCKEGDEVQGEDSAKQTDYSLHYKSLLLEPDTKHGGGWEVDKTDGPCFRIRLAVDTVVFKD